MKNQPEQFTATPLGVFCSKYGLSLSAMSTLAGGASRSTIHRLIHNELAPNYRRKLNRVLAESLPKFLQDKGLDRAEIDQELLQIFDEGEYEPMISQRIELTPDERRFFGLSEDPFAHVPQTRDEVYISPGLQQIIDRAIDAIRYQGFISITGDIGSGKSTIRALIEDYVQSNPNLIIVWPEFFDMKNVSPMQIAEAVLDAFGVLKVPRSSARRGKAVKDLLARLYQDGTRVAIAFDECHRLNDSALSSLKNFLEMNSGGFQRYLGVILFGQPIFEARLRERQFREIVERIVPLKMPDFAEFAFEYLQHRLALVGADVNKLFDREAIQLICGQATTPLQLGNIANEALRISKTDFKNETVVGAAIKTKMFFENRREAQAFRKRA